MFIAFEVYICKHNPVCRLKTDRYVLQLRIECSRIETDGKVLIMVPRTIETVYRLMRLQSLHSACLFVWLCYFYTENHWLLFRIKEGVIFAFLHYTRNTRDFRGLYKVTKLDFTAQPACSLKFTNIPPDRRTRTLTCL